MIIARRNHDGDYCTTDVILLMFIDVRTLEASWLRILNLVRLLQEYL